VVIVIAVETTTRDDSKSPSLCPSCSSASLRVWASASIQYEVRVGGPEDTLAVVGERVSIDGWEPTSEVVCPSCDWRGTVGEVESLLKF
jgi:hypothetical protein